MKNRFFVILASTILIVGMSTAVFAQAYAAPRDANAMGTKVQPQKQPAPVQQTVPQKQVAPEKERPKTTFGPPIVVPWKRGGVYSMADVQKSLQTLGWWISEAKNSSGQYYNPPKLELVATNDENWKILKTDVYRQAAIKFAPGGADIVENDRDTPKWKGYLFRGGITGVRSAVVDVIPKTSQASPQYGTNGK